MRSDPMDVGFVVTALRRRWWIVLVAVVIGVAGALALGLRTGGGYAATAGIQLLPQSSVANDSPLVNPNRYGQSQVALLRSRAHADEVAAALLARHGVELDGRTVLDMTTVAFEERTDLVTVTAEGDAPRLVALVAQTHAETYLEQIPTVDVEAEELPGLRADARALETELAEIDAELAAAVEDAARLFVGGVPDDLDPSALAPSLSSRRQIVLSELTRLNGTISRLELRSQLLVNSKIVVPAAVPDLAEPRRLRLRAVGIAAAASALGIAAALVLAARDPALADRRSIEELLGRPVEVDTRRGPEAIETLAVAVRARTAGIDGAVIVIGGTDEGSGASSVASNLAERLDQHGLDATLIDLHAHHDAAPVRSAITQADADLIVCSVGPFLGSMAAVEAAAEATVVVLTVPIGAQLEASLRAFASGIGARSDVVVVVTDAAGSARPSFEVSSRAGTP